MRSQGWITPLRSGFLAVVLSGLPIPCGGQEAGAGPTTAPHESGAGAVSPAPASPRIRVVPPPDQVDGRRLRQVGLGDQLTVHVQGLASLLDSVNGECERLILYLDGIAIRGLPPESCTLDTGAVRFRLKRTDDSDEAWHLLLGRPKSFSRPVKVSVGSRDDVSVPSDDTIGLIILPKFEFYGCFILLFAAFVLFLYLARTGNILRDPNAVPGTGVRPYSLARFQMAVWFFLVISAYVFMWMITGELDTITPEVLALMGVSSGTALGASLIDSEKKKGAAAEKSRLEGERAGIQGQLAGLQQEMGTAADEASRQEAQAALLRLQARLAEINAQLAKPTVPVKGECQGFLTDVLSDANGINLQRFQMFTWTLILGIIFCAQVYQTLMMPQFSATLLGLMGISSGTYLSFKFPEQHGAGGPAPAASP